MKNKYYTPTTEEFHVGFEYEIEDLAPNFKDRCWRSMVWDMLDSTSTVIDIGLDNYRVKHLDREDIESFGFEKDNNSDEYDNFISNDSDVEIFFDSGNILILDYQNTNSSIFREYELGNGAKYNGQKSALFNGVIKNKSELKRVLTQVRVIEK